MRKTLLILVGLLMALPLMSDEQFSYIFKRGDITSLRSNGSIDWIVRVAKRYDGEYIWAMRDGRQYLIRDAAVLAAARDAFREVDAYHPTVRAVERRAKPVERRAEAIEERMDELSDSLGDDDLSASEEAAAKAELRELKRQFRAIENELRDAEDEVERAENHAERLEEIAERELDRIILRAIRNGLAVRQ